MMPDLAVLAVALPAVFFAGLSKGGFGSGAAFVATPLIALVTEPATALGIMLPMLMLIDAVTVKSFWKRWHGPSAAAVVLGCLPGIALGAMLYRLADPDLFRLLIGGIALAFVVWQVAGRQGWIRLPVVPFRWRGGLVAGTVSGFTSFVSHAGGPPVAIYLLAQGMAKTPYQATTVLIFWAVNILKVVPYAVLGFFTAETLVLNLWLAPAAVAGALAGVRAHHLLPERVFFGITFALLTLTGSKLIWDALT